MFFFQLMGSSLALLHCKVWHYSPCYQVRDEPEIISRDTVHIMKKAVLQNKWGCFRLSEIITSLIPAKHSLSHPDNVEPRHPSSRKYCLWSWTTMWPLIVMDKLVYLQKTIETLAMRDKREITATQWVKEAYSCPCSQRRQLISQRDSNSKEWGFQTWNCTFSPFSKIGQTQICDINLQGL